MPLSEVADSVLIAMSSHFCATTEALSTSPGMAGTGSTHFILVSLVSERTEVRMIVSSKDAIRRLACVQVDATANIVDKGVNERILMSSSTGNVKNAAVASVASQEGSSLGGGSSSTFGEFGHLNRIV